MFTSLLERKMNYLIKPFEITLGRMRGKGQKKYEIAEEQTETKLFYEVF